MAALTATSKTTIQPSLSVPNDLANLNWAPSISKTFTWANGVAAGQVNEVFADDRTVAVSTNDDLDLSGTALSNPGGTAIAFARVKELYIENTHASQSLTVGNGTNPWVGPFGAGTHTLNLPPGGIIHLVAPTAAGWTVTAGTGDILRIANGAGNAGTYRIVILGGLT